MMVFGRVTSGAFFVVCCFLLAHGQTEEEQDIPVVEGFGGNIKIPVEDDVVVLNSDTFNHVILTNEFVLVEFYAPWCGHCKTLAPEYSKAAILLKEKSSSVVIAKIDATIETEIAKKYGVEGYPTLFLFKKGEKEDKYSGPRTAQDLVEYVLSRSDPDYRPPITNVVELTASNFTEFIESKELVLVQFYATWCQHCQQFKPEYEKAAGVLKDDGIALVKINDKQIEDKYSVHHYPTLKVFRFGREYEYKGPREADGIVSHMLDISKSPSSELNCIKEVNKKRDRLVPIVVGAFESKEQPLYQQYIAAAHQCRDELKFFHIFGDVADNEWSIKSGSINFFQPEVYQTKYESSLHQLTNADSSSDDIVSFLHSGTLPLVGERTKQNALLRYNTIFPLVVVYYDVDFTYNHVKATQSVRSGVVEVANEFRDQNIVFAISDQEAFEDELNHIGLGESFEDVKFGLFNEKHQRFSRECPDTFSKDELKQFVQDYLEGKLVPVVKSQPVPSDLDQRGNVRKIVAKSYDKEVAQSDKHVLLELYSPVCGHCEQFEPIYNRIGKFYKTLTETEVVVAKMDGTANDVPPIFKPKGYPTVYLLLKGEKEEPIQFTGERTFEEIKAFVNKHIAQQKSKDEL